jgi:tRNA dimethylallyltransferase
VPPTPRRTPTSSPRGSRAISSTRSSPPPSDLVLALYGPTASGKTAVARALADRVGGEVVSADSAALYEKIPILTAAPSYPARLVGVVPLDRDVSVAEYGVLAHEAIDEIVAGGRTPVVAGGTGLYLRAALVELNIPPAPEPGTRERLGALYDELGPEPAHELLAGRDPAAAARVHPNDRRRVVRALELAEMGASLAPVENRLWSESFRRPTLLVGLDLPLDKLDERIEARVQRMLENGAIEEARTAWGGELSATARKVLGLEELATLPPGDAAERILAATRRLARYQRKWLRRLPVAATLDADRPPERVADEIVAMAGAGERLPRR